MSLGSYVKYTEQSSKRGSVRRQMFVWVISIIRCLPELKALLALQKDIHKIQREPWSFHNHQKVIGCLQSSS
jgi:hypothetical protein